MNTDNTENGKNLIFLISQPRSGSTLLQNMLGRHPVIHTTPEPWIMLHSVYALRRSGHHAEYEAGLAHAALIDFYRELPEGEQTVIESIREAGLHLYNSALSKAKKNIFLDKTPRYYLIIPELHRIFPEARFVFLLRNPLAVLSSILDTWVKRYWPTLANYKNDLLRAPELILNGIDLCGSRAVTIRYEDLIEKPDSHIQALCRELEIDFHESMLSYDTNVMRSGTMGDPVGVHKYTRPVRNSFEKWVTGLSSVPENELAGCYLEALGDLTITRMGYKPDSLRKTLQQSRITGTAEDKQQCHHALAHLDLRPFCFEQDIKTVYKPKKSPQKKKLFTSLAPGNTRAQKSAVTSWHKLGFQVYSVNVEDEITTLKQQYTDVRFVPAKRDARHKFGKPLICIDDILRCGIDSEAHLWGIINSDIELRGESSLCDRLVEHRDGGLLFGSRIDIARHGDTHGKVYDRGFDFFFFSSEAAAVIPPSDYCLGMPWWDIWIPLAAMLHGCQIKKIFPSFAYHLEHSINWNPLQWLKGGALFAEKLSAIIEADKESVQPCTAFVRDFSIFMLRLCQSGSGCSAIDRAVDAEQAFSADDKPIARLCYHLAHFVHRFMSDQIPVLNLTKNYHAAQDGDATAIKKLIAKGRLEEALKKINETSCCDMHPEIITLKGEVLFGLNRVSEAKELFVSAAEKWPQAVDVINNLAVIEMVENNYTRAHELLQQALAIDAGNEFAQKNLHTIETSDKMETGASDIRLVS